MIKKGLKIKNFRAKKRFIRQYFLYKKQIRKSLLKRRRFLKRGTFRIKKMRKKFFSWKKKKKHKSLRHRHNFIFFFSKRKKRFPRLCRRWFLFQYKILKKSPLDLLKALKNVWFDLKIRFKSRLKNKVLKKRALTRRLKSYYCLTAKAFKGINVSLKKKKKNKTLQLLFLLEFRIVSVCLRFHFFWNLTKSYYWVSQGVIAINNFRVFCVYSRIQVNDFIKIVGPRSLWRKKLIKLWGLKRYHTKFYYSFNCSELIYIISSGIILRVPIQINEIKAVFRKKRKSWLNLNTFLYLINSFY